MDGFARPLAVRLEGDRRRPEDDVCLEIEYAAPVPGAPLVLEVAKTIRSHQCDNRSRVFATTFLTYDDLPHGQVAIGRVSGRRLERRNLASGALLPEAPAGMVCFLCGPKPMSEAAERALRALGVGSRQIHVELFDMV